MGGGFTGRMDGVGGEKNGSPRKSPGLSEDAGESSWEEAAERRTPFIQKETTKKSSSSLLLISHSGPNAEHTAWTSHVGVAYQHRGRGLGAIGVASLRLKNGFPAKGGVACPDRVRGRGLARRQAGLVQCSSQSPYSFV